MPNDLQFELAIDIDASPAAVWTVLMDLARWHEWTPSIRRIWRLDFGDLAPGMAVRIWQPGLARAVWRVTELVPGERFTWATRSAGVRSTASHRIERRGAGSRVTLAVRHEGVVALLLRRWLSRVTERYVAMEALGLKARCERDAGSPQFAGTSAGTLAGT